MIAGDGSIKAKYFGTPADECGRVAKAGKELVEDWLDLLLKEEFAEP